MSTETQKHKALRNILSCAIITEAINVIEDEHKIFAMNRMSTIRRVACKNRIYRQPTVLFVEEDMMDNELFMK